MSRSSAPLRIGDVARRAGVTPRLVRYYEQQGLLTAPRSDNGYRTYGEEHVERVRRIAQLVQSGVTTRLVKVLLDAEDACANELPTCPREVAELLAAELQAIDGRIECLTRSRDTIRELLRRTHRELLDGDTSAAQHQPRPTRPGQRARCR